MKIRKLTPKDIVPASKIVGTNYSRKDELSSRKEMEAMFKNYAYAPQYVVAEENGEARGVAGYIQSWMDYHIYQIFWVNVKPKYQRRGIGTGMIQEIIRLIKRAKGDNKAYVIQLTTTSPGFYERFGFKKVQLFRRNHNKDHYLMSLNLLKRKGT